MLDRKTKIHLIGVGGIGMSALAQVYADLGYRVSGSDQNPGPILERLKRHGVQVHIGHRAENVGDADLVVYSTAIREDNPERAAALASGKTLWKRAQLLNDALSDKRSVVVTGCHGKTTTSSMIAWMLAKLGKDPSALIGGEIAALGGNALSGKGEIAVAEGDESDKSFLFLNPDVAVVTNIDFDHPDHYRDLDDAIWAYRSFLSRVRAGGTCVLCYDDELSRETAAVVSQPVLGYGFHEQADVRAVDWEETPELNRGEVWHGKNRLGRLSLQLSGRFNFQNALAAVAVSRLLHLDFSDVAKVLGEFPGVGRRMELKGCAAGVRVYDDYAHHPAEVAATLTAFERKARGRKIVVFQPHRFSRTRTFAGGFAQALKAAEVLIVTGIYSAGDTPMEGVSGRSIFDRIEPAPARYYRETLDECLELLKELVQPGDTVLTAGAGNVYRLGERLLEELKKRESTSARP